MLATGGHYKFTISAINAIGEGSLSLDRSIIAASRPDQPAQPSKKTAAASYIEIEWVAPSNGGSDIRGYVVYKTGQTDGI